MVKFMDKKDIIMQKEQGLSNREVSRKTVSKYWEAYRCQLRRLEEPGADVKAIQERLLAEPTYDASRRVRRKYTEELDKRLKTILKEEEKKNRLFGPGHKHIGTHLNFWQEIVDYYSNNT